MGRSGRPASEVVLRAGPLALEPLLEAHAAEMFVLLSDPAIYEFENAPPRSLEALQERYAKLESRTSEDGSQQWLNWIIRLPDGQVAGFMQATVLAGGRAYVAYELGSRYWRQGIASSSLQVVLRELASRHAVRDVFAVLKAVNHRSLGLLTKAGFAPLPAGMLAPWAAEPDETTVHKSLVGIWPAT
jgi:ribosomal-protein-alanine N-acetyltransferase